MKLYEMEGFLRGKCIPGDLKVNETNAEYLVRKFSEADDRCASLSAKLRMINDLTEAAEQANKLALREELSNPAIGSKDHLRKLALSLLDELEHYKSREERVTKLVLDNSTSWDALYKKLEAAEKRIAGLSKAASVNNHWKPDVCPITGRKFFMWIEHETLGYVPTYGGPFDSYTIPTRDSSGEFSCERYDHDFGGWVEGEFIGLYLIDDDEQCRVCELEERIAELEAKLETADRLQDSA
ncbi:hypothetical protein DK684_24525, partial [Salmonella enterica subsp. diarizonae]|nr:hypothetical protein [Salmonella enterica subsp. diarizonae]